MYKQYTTHTHVPKQKGLDGDTLQPSRLRSRNGVDTQSYFLYYRDHDATQNYEPSVNKFMMIEQN